MAEGRHARGVGWYDPDPRAIMPLDGFHCPRSLGRLMRRGVFEMRRDTAFEAVIRACAAPRDGDGDDDGHGDENGDGDRDGRDEPGDLDWETDAGGDGGGWINDEIIAAYVALHRMGVTHSVEAWRDGVLVGGLYGVALGSAFFAESMFHRADLGGSNASKACVAHLVAHLNDRGFTLLDLQMVTPITARLGAVEIPRRRFRAMLREALRHTAQF
jgi:leucyl/phenylalanyl-tRNA--protein transferase